jgi:hypothetical protein
MDATAFREYAGALSTLVIDARFVLLALILSIVATLVVVRNVLPRLIGLVVRLRRRARVGKTNGNTWGSSSRVKRRASERFARAME